MFCIRCGARNDDTHRFCARCGQALTPPPAGAGFPPAPALTHPAPAAPLAWAAGAAAPLPAASAPPRVPFRPLGAAGAREFGSPLRRLGAAGIDVVVLSVLVAAAESVLFGGHAAGSLLAIPLYWLYFAGSESSGWQATPGKRLLDLRVVGENGDTLSFGRASGRFFGKLLSTLLFGIGLLMIFFDDEHQGMHDSMADAWAVKD